MKVALSFHFQNFRDALLVEKQLRRQLKMLSMQRKYGFEAAIEEEIEIHEPDSLEEYSGQFKLRMPRSLHRSLVEHSKREGISMNQYCVYLLSKNDALFSK